MRREEWVRWFGAGGAEAGFEKAEGGNEVAVVVG